MATMQAPKRNRCQDCCLCHRCSNPRARNCDRGGGRKSPCAACCRSFATFAFSTIGLVLAMLLYLAAGGYLFRWIEQDHEIQDIAHNRRRMEDIRKAHIEALWNLTENLNVFYKHNWTVEAENIFRSFQTDVHRTAVTTKWDGKAPTETVVPKWGLPESLLYAVTAITTIGYGHVTPSTNQGKLCTMLYALLGIPLTVMCMANMGKFLAKVFRLIYQALCCGLFCCVCCKGSSSFSDPKCSSQRTSSDGLAGYTDNKTKDQTATLFTRNGSPLAACHFLDGNWQTGTNIGTKTPNISELPDYTRGVRSSDDRCMCSHTACEENIHSALYSEATVPIYLCLVVMATYICAGAILFGIWEDWGLATGAYFCFVTLTTIGFGDYVPGITVDENDERSTLRLASCAVYVFFGLALIAMCFDLMREAVTLKVLWFGRKIGLITEDM